MELSIHKLSVILQKIYKSDWAADDRIMNMPPNEASMAFLQAFQLVFEVGDFGGAILINHMSIGRSAEVSMLIWDRKMMRRHEDARQFLKWLMYTFQLLRLTAHLTETNTLAMRYDLKIGFKQEGVTRDAIVRHGVPKNVVQLGITREEVGLP